MAAQALQDNETQGPESFLGARVPFAGKYAVERILGIGGMGTVFEARHIRLGHRVAIKVLGSELRDYPELVTRFEREARAAGSLTSRHAVRVFDIDMTEDATPFIVMELLAGQDLARIVETEGAQPVPRAVRWVIEACDAIAEAHRLGIIHRDIKPSNLFLTTEGVKVLDFGIAKRVAAKEVSITQSVAPLGTPQYMSPEQVRCAKDVDARTDVWSLGVTLYELVTGKTPFVHEIPQACIASIVADPVPDPRTLRADLPPELVAVIMKALAKNVADRWSSVAELVNALAPFAQLDDEDEPSTAVRKVIESATRTIRAADSTLDGETSEAPPPPNVLLESGVRPSMRPRLDSDDSLPPAVTKIHAPSRSRLHSTLALVAAAVLGIGALVMTPTCAGNKVATPATAAMRVNVPARAIAVASAPAAPVEAAPAAEPEPVKEMTPVVVKKPAAHAVTTASAKIAKPVRPEAATRSVYGDSPVHGGLSNPGF